MTSEEKLAKILAMRMMRDVLQQHMGIIDFHEMIKLVTSHSVMELSNGEANALLAIKAILARKDDNHLENDMKRVDDFKKLLSAQFDSLIRHLKMELAG